MLSQCDFITASKNDDGTFRIVGITTVVQEDGTEADAIVQIDRAIVHIDALDGDDGLVQMTVPNIFSEENPE